MKSLFEYLILEGRSISQSEWASYKIKNQGGITNELKAMLGISSAKELKLDGKSRAKCTTPEGRKSIKSDLGLTKSGDLIEVFTQAFKAQNILSTFASSEVEEIEIMGNQGLQVKLSSGWQGVAAKTASSARCIKFWMQSIAISCEVISLDSANFEVGINQTDAFLYIFMR